MGGQGSGRKPNPANTASKNYAEIAKASTPIYIPNYSGIKDAAKKTSTTSFLQAGDNISELTNDSGFISSVEGTAVLSTGEAGGIKFLREDGDGTCSWQTPTAAEVNDLTAAVTWANVPDANITQSSVTQHEGAINHDNLTGFVGNEHIDWTIDQGATDIHSGNIPDLSATYQPLDADLTAIGALAKTDSNFIVGNGSTWVAESGATARTSLGVGTGNSPQFTAVNVGHATDTTVARASAGQISVEGVQVATASNTLTLTNKSIVASQITAGTFATGDFVFNGDLEVNNCITFDAEYDNGNSGAADTIDWNNGNKQKSTLTANCTYTFTAPPGACNILLKVIQDATGSRTVTWPASVKWPGGTAPTLSTAASSVDIITFYYDGTNYYGVDSLNFS